MKRAPHPRSKGTNPVGFHPPGLRRAHRLCIGPLVAVIIPAKPNATSPRAHEHEDASRLHLAVSENAGSSTNGRTCDDWFGGPETATPTIFRVKSVSSPPTRRTIPHRRPSRKTSGAHRQPQGPPSPPPRPSSPIWRKPWSPRSSDGLA